MVAAALGDDPVNMIAIGRNDAADILGGKEKEALDAILLLRMKGIAALALQEGAGSPGGAPKYAGGVGGSGHGVEVLVELEGGDLLGFIHREEQIGGGTHDLGMGFAGEELEAGFPQHIYVAVAGTPAETRTDTSIEGLADAQLVVGGLGFEGRRDGDDTPANMGVTKEKPGEEVSLELVLAGLAGEDDHKGEAQMVDDGLFNGEGDTALVGTEVDATGGSPADGIAADGFADTEGEGGGGGRIKHEGHLGFQW